MTIQTFKPTDFRIGTPRIEDTGSEGLPLGQLDNVRDPRHMEPDTDQRRGAAAKYPLYDMEIGEGFMYRMVGEEVQEHGLKEAVNRRRSRISVSAKNQGLRVKVRKCQNPAGETCLIATRVE